MAIKTVTLTGVDQNGQSASIAVSFEVSGTTPPPVPVINGVTVTPASGPANTVRTLTIDATATMTWTAVDESGANVPVTATATPNVVTIPG